MKPAHRIVHGVFLAGALALLLLLVPDPAWAQEPAAESTGRQMRHFWHVFAAYAIAWGLIFAWVVSIGLRLRRVEDRLRS